MAKTITEKLSLHKYEHKAVLYMPENSPYAEEFRSFVTKLVSGEIYDLIFAFVLDMESMRRIVSEVIEGCYINKGGYLYLAYPKKGNKVYSTFIHRDELMDGLEVNKDGFIGSSNVKFSRMVGMDEVFTIVGLKEDSKGKMKPANKASQSVGDYIEHIPQIENDLAEHVDLLSFYQSLTPGYKRDWARYVYSAKQEATKEKRRQEMKVILEAGFKSRDLYRREHN
ncbi:YdeI/OmpD-associated family protein [Niallia taxi]|uniref:YdeI/OmpD-associated family protein n=2 Tax=Niallia taxi TaxID=2499688 RepID=UPI0030084B1A